MKNGIIFGKVLVIQCQLDYILKEQFQKEDGKMVGMILVSQNVTKEELINSILNDVNSGSDYKVQIDSNGESTIWKLDYSAVIIDEPVKKPEIKKVPKVELNPEGEYD